MAAARESRPSIAAHRTRDQALRLQAGRKCGLSWFVSDHAPDVGRVHVFVQLAD